MLTFLALVAAAAPRPPIEVLWSMQLHGQDFTYARLYGVDPVRHSAIIVADDTRREPPAPEARYLLVEIDSQEGVERSRWSTTVGEADPLGKELYGWLWPLVDSPEDVARLGEIATGVGAASWHDSELLLPSAAGLVHHRYGPDGGDWLVLRDRDGSHPRRLAAGHSATYTPTVSPDGRQIAYCAYTRGLGNGDPYRVYLASLASLESGGERLVPGTGHMLQMAWTEHGILAMQDDGSTPQCLEHIDPVTRKTQDWQCGEGLSDVRFALDSAGAFGAFYGRTADALEVRWFSPQDGRTLKTMSIPTGGRVEQVLPGGVLLVSVRGGLLLVDAARGGQVRQGLIPAPDDGFLAAPVISGLDGERLLVARWHRLPSRLFEVLTVDVEAVLSGR